MLLNINQNAKTVKGNSIGYLTGILYLAPSDISGYNVCPMAKVAKCERTCLYYSGMGAFSNVQKARIEKTKYFHEDTQTFMQELAGDISSLIRKAKKLNLTPTVRLNGTSDIRWENIPVNGFNNIMEMFPNIQFYDYTKIPNRKNIPSNYHLTLSYSNVEEYKRHIMKANPDINLAVVFKKELPITFMGRKVIDGDKHDVRFIDQKNVVVGLKAKGKAKYDNDFVVNV